MDPREQRRDAKKQKQHLDLLNYVADSQYGIPHRCPCGGRIIKEVGGKEEFDTVPGKRFFTCLNYEDDGLPFRQPWVFGVQEEIEKLTKRVEKAEEVIKHVSTINNQIIFLEEQVKNLQEQVDYLTVRIADLERLCFD